MLTLALDLPSNGWMVVLLLFATAVLMLLEVLTPSFGILLGLSIISAGGAVYYAFAINYILGLVVLLGILVTAPFYLYASVKLLPNTPLGKRLFLRAADKATNDATPDWDELKELIGQSGTAETVLRPSGMVRIDSRRVNATAERGMIERGEAIRVIRSTGTEVIVRRLDKNHPSDET